jgi:hypothetical protein
MVVALGSLLATWAFAGSATATTFSGRCALAGSVTFGVPVSLLPQFTSHAFDGRGVCDGTLDGQPVEGVPVEEQELAPSGISSCTLNAATNIATRLTFYPGTAQESSLRMRVTTVGAGAIVLLYQGESSGQAAGLLTFPGDAELVKRCATGTLTRSPVNQTLGTLTTLSG